MPRFIHVEVRQVYGKDTVYPADDAAREFTKLTGRKTFSHADLCAIEALGFEIRQHVPALVRR